MAGYIAITMSDWLDCIAASGNSSAVFWCKKKNFKALLPGEKFYFLERGQFRSNADRFIVGSGEFLEFKKGKSFEVWDKYTTKLGFSTLEELEEHIEAVYHNKTFEIGCIVLNNIAFFNRKISLDECGVDFSPYIVSGKCITSDECIRIEKAAKEIENG